MSSVSTHVLDTARGRPAVGVPVVLEAATDGGWTQLGAGVTDHDGRAAALVDPGAAIAPGVHRLTFDTGAWFADQGQTAFYPQVAVTFEIGSSDDHYHVPLLLSPFGYSTYRGS